MTDQNQVQDPKKPTQQDNNQENDVFGGDDDIFENSDILQPIDENGEKEQEKSNNIQKENTKQDSPIVEEKIEELEPIKEIDDTKNKETTKEDNIQKNNFDDDFFDPFNEDAEKTAPKPKTPKIEEPKQVETPKVEEPKIEEPLTKTSEKQNEETKKFDKLEPIQEIDKQEFKEQKETEEEGKKEEKEEKNEKEKIEEIKKPTEENKTNIKYEEKDKTNDKFENKKDNIDTNGSKSFEGTKSVEENTKPQIENQKDDNKNYVAPVVNNTKKEEPKTQEEKETEEETTNLQKKFDELSQKTKNIYKLVEKDLDKGFDLIGGNDNRIKTTYTIYLFEKNKIKIQKNEFMKHDETTIKHDVQFTLNNKSLDISVDGDLLYKENEDLNDNPKKQMQVMEKLNKFIFLVDEEHKKIEKEKSEKEKRRKIKGIFRNFVM